MQWKTISPVKIACSQLQPFLFVYESRATIYGCMQDEVSVVTEQEEQP